MTNYCYKLIVQELSIHNPFARYHNGQKGCGSIVKFLFKLKSVLLPDLQTGIICDNLIAVAI